LEFRERLIVDYLNVLNDQKDLLEIRKLKLNEAVQELKGSFQSENKKIKRESMHFKLKELFEDLIEIPIGSIFIRFGI